MQGFAGWKAGMTHILSRDLNPHSPSAGQEVRIPVTVVECPKMRILGVRGYTMTPYGKQAAGEVWADAGQITEAFPDLFKRLPVRKEHDAETHFENLDKADLVEVRLIAATQPSGVPGIPTKTPDVMEIGLDGGNIGEQLSYAKERLGEEYSFADAFEEGVLTDIVAITKGYGWQGVIKRFGKIAVTQEL
jgi:large subunit ribosomal protein L3